MTTSQHKSDNPQVKANSKGADAYRDPSWWYDIRGFFILMGTYQVMIWSHLAFFARNLGNVHLEAAIGSGTFMALTLTIQKLKGGKMPEEIVGIDYAERMLNGAKRLFQHKKNIHLIQADLSDINYPDAYFDSVNIAHSFHAFPDPVKVLKELHRVMIPQAELYVDVLLEPLGGPIRKAIATRVNNFCFKKGILARTCDPEETKAQFEENHFEIINSFIKGNTYHVIARKQ